MGRVGLGQEVGKGRKGGWGGVELGVELGEELGVELGEELGEELGVVLGVELGEELGVRCMSCRYASLVSKGMEKAELIVKVCACNVHVHACACMYRAIIS